MMEAVQTSETLVNTHQSTRRYNPEDRHLHAHRREDLKQHVVRGRTGGQMANIMALIQWGIMRSSVRNGNVYRHLFMC
jgi:hypothetical protein